MVPTKELAQQVADEFKALTLGMQFSAACFIGAPMWLPIDLTQPENIILLLQHRAGY
ncbi:hypothetical protein [Niabella hibiscisoli]|uniref:hypothetical protein n=1 Tax=Niabella hibiscisoli TaxID=1825928 RepID=UPI001F1131BA|nr:hypothetical protein [Niabella hibiscisoli]MCH5719402.1 hypothetical protein [Niabella hibiscisoli]